MSGRDQAAPAADPARILVVDDEEDVRTPLARFLKKVGFGVETARDGEEAMAKLAAGDPYSLVILDVRMPGMDGIEVLSRALELDPDLAVVMLTGVSDATTAAICMQRGAYDYLTKPIGLDELRTAIDQALRRRDTALQDRDISSWLRDELDTRTRELQREREDLERVTVATLEALINALEAKDPYIIGHSARVAALAATLAHQLRLSDDEIEAVRTAGRLHDIGKIGIRESVLTKKAPLTSDEYAHVKDHVLIGYQILLPLKHLGPVASYVKHHHEHFDGNGYPNGLKGDEIPVGSRIIGAAEIFDALTTSRPYHDSLDSEEATERMRRLAGNVLDPRVVEALEKAVSRRQTLTFLQESYD